MKKITFILSAALLLTLGVSSCMDDFDTPVTGNAYGNNTIKEQRTISIANLKEKYSSVILANQFQTVTEETRISGIVVGDDESGNIYKQLIVADETGAIVVGINSTGIYANCPVGQKVVIDCENLNVGGYGMQAQIGTTYKGAIGRMDLAVWLDHVRVINKPQLWYDELIPMELTGAQLKAYDKDLAPVLVMFKDVTIKEADGTATFAPEDLKDGGNGVNRTLVLDDNSTLTFRTSTYANFSTEVMPTGKINVIGILSRYNSTWQIVARTYSDIQRNN